MSLGDAADEALLAATETTSMWVDYQTTSDLLSSQTECVPHAVAALNDLPGSLTYTDMPAYDPVKHEIDHLTDIRPNAKMMSIQLIKHNGQVSVFIDGVRSPGTLDAITQRTSHKFYWHRGRHMDIETKTWAFSPCAFTYCIEDGQRMPVNPCTISVWSGIDKNKSNWKLLGEEELAPFSTSQPTFKTVITPYPLDYCRNPTVGLIDTNNLERFDISNFRANVGSLSGLFKNSLDFFRTNYDKLIANDIAGSNRLTTAFLNTVENFSIEYVMSLLIWFAMWYGGGFITTFLTYIVTQTPLAPGNTPSREGGLAGVLGRALETIGQQAETPTDPNQFKTFIAKALFAGTAKFFQKRPQIHKVNLTVKDLASVLERIAGISDRTNASSFTRDEMIEYLATESWKTEHVIIKYLLRKPAQRKLITNQMNVRQGFTTVSSDIPMELDRFNFVNQNTKLKPEYSSCIHVKIDTSELCEGANKQSHQVHEFECGIEMNKRQLAAVSMGFLEDMDRLERAIDKLEQVCKLNYNLQNNSKFWMDNWIFFGVFDVTRLSQETKTMLLTQRSDMIRTILQNIDPKLRALFTNYKSPGQLLKREALDALNQSFPKPSPNVFYTHRKIVTHLRVLPQRMQMPKYLFPFAKDVDLEFTDIDTASAVVRQFSDLHDCAKAYNQAMYRSRTSVRRILETWERTSERLILVAAVEKVTLKSNPQPCLDMLPVDTTTLVLQIPDDIRLQSELTNLCEDHDHRLKRLLTLRPIKREFVKKDESTLLEGIGLKETGDSMIIMSAMGQIWSEELVKFAIDAMKTPNRVRSLQIMESASDRAVRRLNAAAAWMIAISKNRRFGIVPRFDPAFLATQAGRDASIVIRKILLRDFNWSPSLTCNLVRRVAKAMIGATGKWSKAPCPSHIPSEQVQSLFINPLFGFKAYLRVHACFKPLLSLPPNVGLQQIHLENASKLLNACTDAYPSVRLLVEEKQDDKYLKQAKGMDQPTPASLCKAITSSQMCNELKMRMGRLRFDFESIKYVDDTLDTTNKLVDYMAALNITGNPSVSLFYVPFGYGDPLPPLTTPLAPACLLGSVPIYTAHLKTFCDMAIAPNTALKTRNKSTKIVIDPRLGCIDSNDMEESKYPIFMYAWYSNADVTVRFSASDRPIDKFGDVAKDAPKKVSFPTLPDVGQATYQNKSDLKTLEFSASVSSIAWNAERILQAVLLGVSSMQLDNLDPADDTSAIDVEFDLTEFQSATKIQPVPPPQDRNEQVAIVNSLDGAILDLKLAMQSYNDQARLLILNVIKEYDELNKRPMRDRFAFLYDDKLTSRFQNMFGDKPTNQNAAMDEDSVYDIADVEMSNAEESEFIEADAMHTGAAVVPTIQEYSRLIDRDYLNLAALILWGKNVQLWNGVIFANLDAEFPPKANSTSKKPSDILEDKKRNGDDESLNASLKEVQAKFQALKDTVRKYAYTDYKLENFCILSRKTLEYDFDDTPRITWAQWANPQATNVIANEDLLLNTVCGKEALDRLKMFLDIPSNAAPKAPAKVVQETKQEERLDWVLSSIPIGLSLAQELLQYGNITLNWNNASFSNRDVFKRQRLLFSVDQTAENIPSMRFGEVCAITRSILN